MSFLLTFDTKPFLDYLWILFLMKFHEISFLRLTTLFNFEKLRLFWSPLYWSLWILLLLVSFISFSNFPLTKSFTLLDFYCRLIKSSIFLYFHNLFAVYSSMLMLGPKALKEYARFPYNCAYALCLAECLFHIADEL